MKQTIFKYGLTAGIIIITIPAISGLIMGYGKDTFAIGEVIGYATMIFSLMMIFLAVSNYQNQNPNEHIGFTKIFIIGSGISFIAGLMFGIYNVIYVLYIDPDFMNNYYEYTIDNIKNSDISAEAINQKIKAMESEKEMFMKPSVNFFLMFITVFVIGLVVSAISGLFQKDKNTQESKPA
ncbi:MAG: DUF4199 domain-containing protein [Kangiellaceae bacterium]